MSLLTGEALKWATVIMEGSGESITTYEQFVIMFKRVFDHFPEVREVSEGLLTTWQGKSRAAEFALEFCTLAV